MRSKLLRALALAGALAALSIPVASATHVAACSTGDSCTTSTSAYGSLDSYISPLSVGGLTTYGFERQTTTQTTGPIVLHGQVGFTVVDPRGNNQGFLVNLNSTDFSSSLVVPTIPAADAVVTGPALVTPMCWTRETLTCATVNGFYDPTFQAETLDQNPVVAVQCPMESIGLGEYAIKVPVDVTISNTTAAELFGSLPFSYEATFNAIVTEGQSLSVFTSAPYNCPPL